MKQNEPAGGGDDGAVTSAGLRDGVIAGAIILPVNSYGAFEHETFLDLRVIVLGVDAAGFHAHQGRACAGHAVDVKHLQLGARSDIEPHTLGSKASRRRCCAADTALDRCPRGCGRYHRRHPLQQRHQAV